MKICEYKRSVSFFDLEQFQTSPQNPVSNISKSTRPIITKFHIEPPEVEEMKTFSKGPGLMTNMVTMPKCVYDANL